MTNDLNTPDEDELIREHQLLVLMPVSRSTLHRLIAKGRFPAGAKIAPKIRVWRRSTVLEWLDEKLRNPAEGENRP
jgi:predicted DNA-binding transcriptional regulator AlpA